VSIHPLFLVYASASLRWQSSSPKNWNTCHPAAQARHR
jgi:hypothetical protein